MADPTDVFSWWWLHGGHLNCYLRDFIALAVLNLDSHKDWIFWAVSMYGFGKIFVQEIYDEFLNPPIKHVVIVSEYNTMSNLYMCLGQFRVCHHSPRLSYPTTQRLVARAFSSPHRNHHRTLTLFESAAMSDKHKDRLVAKGLGLLAAINDVPRLVRRTNIPGGSLKARERDVLRIWIEEEARHGSSWLCEYLPPLSILKCSDLFDRHWGWDRLLAYNLHREFEDPSDMPMYESYLEKFYAYNDHHHNAANAILQCLEKEKALRSYPRAKLFNIGLSKDIEECLSNLVNDAGSESRRPFLTYAAACITKEAELMIEWLSQGYRVPLEEYDASNEIRQCALDLAMFEGKWNTHTAAVLLGITKEAVSLLERARLGCFVCTDISLKIRSYGLHFLLRKLDEFEDELTPGVSDEMTCAIEINELTWGNTESVSIGKNEMQEQCVSKKITKPVKKMMIIPGLEFPIRIIQRPDPADEEAE